MPYALLVKPNGPTCCLRAVCVIPRAEDAVAIGVGAKVGEAVGNTVGETVGESVGDLVGESVGN